VLAPDPPVASSSTARTSAGPAAQPHPQKGIARSYQITNILPNATTLENCAHCRAVSRRHSWSMIQGTTRDYQGHHRQGRSVLQAVGLLERPMIWPPISRTGQQRNLEIGIAPRHRAAGFSASDAPTAGMSAARTARHHAAGAAHLQRSYHPDRRARHAGGDGAGHRITVLHYGEILAEGAPRRSSETRGARVYLKT
jgi:branched-chain amino acid transport system ATP-binding protein